MWEVLQKQKKSNPENILLDWFHYNQRNFEIWSSQTFLKCKI